jgi:hypothetical protein
MTPHKYQLSALFSFRFPPLAETMGSVPLAAVLAA